jgi:hypothetical protein
MQLDVPEALVAAAAAAELAVPPLVLLPVPLLHATRVAATTATPAVAARERR